MAFSVDRHLFFFHHFQKCGLRLARGPVDLVCQQQATLQYRPLLIAKFSASPIIHGKTGDIRRHDIRRKLDPPVRQSQRFAERQRQRGLADARHVLQQDIALCQDRHQDPFDDCLLAADDFAGFR